MPSWEDSKLSVERLFLHLLIHRPGLLVGPRGIDRSGADAIGAHAVFALLVGDAADQWRAEILFEPP